jgi:uncharacterized membrane protein YjjP (DUF1212 family)
VDDRAGDDPRALEAFVIELGAALNAAGEPVYSVQQRLTDVAKAYGAHGARVSAFPTFLMVTMGAGEPALLELTTTLASSPRLDQIAALDRLVGEAERGTVAPVDGLRRLDEIRTMHSRFTALHGIVGYALFSTGVCLILHPALRDVAAAAIFGALVGLLRSAPRGPAAMQTLLPVAAAFMVSALSALALRHQLMDPGLRAMVASLVVFLPGAALTTSVLELAAGQVMSGSSRLVAGIVQLALLTFGIVAGIETVGVPAAQVLTGSPDVLGAWAPSVGVLVFAIGVTIANSAPARSFPGLLVVLYSAWAAQLLANEVLGGYVSALAGAAVMTPVAYWVSRLPSAMPPLASFLPGFWLLVPGAIGLIGITELATEGNNGSEDLLATIVSMFAVAVGVLVGNIFLTWTSATGRAIGKLKRTPLAHTLRVTKSGSS